MTVAAPDHGSFTRLYAAQRVEAVAAISADSCAVSVRVLPDEDAIWIRLIGAVDLGSALTLSRAVDRIQEVLPRTVLIDLASVTFAGFVLAHFLLGIHAAGRRRICLLRAGPTIRMIVTATGIDQFVTLAEDLPGWLAD